MINLSEIKETVHNYDNLRARLVKIIEIMKWVEIDIEDIYYIKLFNKDTKDGLYVGSCYDIANSYNCDIMGVSYENRDEDEMYCDEYIPVDWLFLTDSSLRDAVAQEQKRRKEAQEKIEQQAKEARSKMLEARERREYERLKAKFEKQEIVKDKK